MGLPPPAGSSTLPAPRLVAFSGSPPTGSESPSLPPCPALARARLPVDVLVSALTASGLCAQRAWRLGGGGCRVSGRAPGTATDLAGCRGVVACAFRACPSTLPRRGTLQQTSSEPVSLLFPPPGKAEPRRARPLPPLRARSLSPSLPPCGGWTGLAVSRGRWGLPVSQHHSTTTSDQTRRPAEFKHITKRRKRN